MSESVQNRLRLLVQDCLGKQMHKAAAFYAEKLVAFSGSLEVDVYLLSQAYFQGRQYRRALAVLSKERYVEMDMRFRYLAARCLAEVEEWDKCLALIGDSEATEPPAVQHLRATEAPSSGSEVGLYSSVCLLRGRAFEAQENMGTATHWFQRALEADAYNYEAFEAISANHMLTSHEEARLIDRIEVPSSDRWLELVYRVSCKKCVDLERIEVCLDELEGRSGSSAGPNHGGSAMDMDHGETPRTPACIGATPGPSDGGSVALRDSLDVASCRADLLYARGLFQECYVLCGTILGTDPHQPRALQLYIGAANELGKKGDLFVIAHRLVDQDPEAALSWYAVGAYYLCTRQFEQARKYLYKATTLDPRCAAAWIAFGNAFAALDEADQAMSAYRTAARLFPGLHLPFVGIGMEHLRTSNLVLADQNLRLARQLCPTDASVLNELGVIAFRNGDYVTAASHLEDALRCVPAVNKTWETALVNYGHALRKLRRYEEARAQYSRALSMHPMSAPILGALAYTFHLEGRLDEAINAYHMALTIRPDDPFTSDLLGTAIEEHGRNVQLVFAS